MVARIDFPGRPDHLRGALLSFQQGFTIVELITVVILLGILSVVAVARFIEPGAFAPGILVHAVVTEGRFAQQLAASRSDARVSLLVDRLGSDWRFRTITDVDGVVRIELVAAEDTLLSATSGAASSDINAADALLVDFDSSGDLADVIIAGSSGDAMLGVELNVIGANPRVACIHPSGYTSNAACI